MILLLSVFGPMPIRMKWMCLAKMVNNYLLKTKEHLSPNLKIRFLKIGHIQIRFLQRGGMAWENLLNSIWTCWSVMEGLYTRKYKKLMGTLDQARKNLSTAIAPMGCALMWQVMMLENFDFKYEKQYKTAFDIAEEELEEAIKSTRLRSLGAVFTWCFGRS